MKLYSDYTATEVGIFPPQLYIQKSKKSFSVETKNSKCKKYQREKVIHILIWYER